VKYYMCTIWIMEEEYYVFRHMCILSFIKVKCVFCLFKICKFEIKNLPFFLKF
jgi:hypothetical protein